MHDEISENIRYRGLKASLRVASPDVVRPLLDPIMKAWPSTVDRSDPPDAAPFATLRPCENGRWLLEAPLAQNPIARHNPVNAICDLVVEMSWERLRSRPELLCLHAAAVMFDDRLVIFPNARRAGKSLLSATLSGLGYGVFSDDFVPLAVDAETQVISGIANGIAPRLRLPLPDNLSASLDTWINDRIGPANRQYGYLTGIDLPLSGTAAPVGAVVVLERDPDLVEPASLTPVSQDDAMAALVMQNFGRQVHAGAILTVTAALTRSVPVLRLRYNAVEEAAALLSQSNLLRDLPAACMPKTGQTGTLPPASLDVPKMQLSAPVDLAQTFHKLPGYTETETETGLYLADGPGVAIHRLNPVSTVIWKLLDAPLSGADMVGVMQEIYPDIDGDRLHVDVQGALRFLIQQRLIAVAASSAV